MSIATIKRQPVNQQKRKCTRADPTQTRILLKNYDAEARPSAEQFADISRDTNLCAVLITFAALSDISFGSCLCALTFFGLPCRPVDWIKKWFLRKRKADGKNRTLVPTEPTFVENDSLAHDGRALEHAHSKFLSMGAFAAADSTSFSPSVGHIPKFYGHRKRSLPPGNVDNDVTDSQGDEEESAILSSNASAETGYSYVAPFDSVVTGENGEIATPASYDLREVLLGADAFSGYVSPSATDEDASGSPVSEHPNITLMVDELISVAASPERSTHPGNPFDGRFSHSESVTNLEFGTTNYPVAPMSSPIDTIGDFISASGDLDLVATTSCSTSDDFELGVFDSVTGLLDSDLVSLPGFSDLPSYMTSILGGPSAFHESLLFQGKQDSAGDSIDVTSYGSLLGADHSVFTLTRVKSC